MLKGAENALKSCSFLFLEVSWIPWDEGVLAGELLHWLEARGFFVYDICTYSMRPLDKRLAQSDILLASSATGLFSDKRWHK